MGSSLTRTQLRTWVTMVTGLNSLLNALDRQLRRDHGISHDDYQTLSWLSRSPAQVRTMSDLARAVGQSPSRLSHVIVRMEQNGWVRRELASDDRRVARPRLTAAGSDFVRMVSADHLALVRELLFDTLGENGARELAEHLDQVGRVARTDPTDGYSSSK